MLFLSLLMGGVLGIIQGYALSPYNLIVTRLSIVLGYRLFFGPHKEATTESPVAVVFVVIGLLLGIALYLLPMTLIAVLTPGLKRTGYLLSWCWMFGLGMAFCGRKQERQNRWFR